MISAKDANKLAVTFNKNKKNIRTDVYLTNAYEVIRATASDGIFYTRLQYDPERFDMARIQKELQAQGYNTSMVKDAEKKLSQLEVTW